MENLQNIRPSLIEPGVKYFLNASLEQCHTFKIKYYNFLYNLALFIGFIMIVSITLYIKYKNKHNINLQKENKKKQDEYILNKLRFMQDYKLSQKNTFSTGLPHFSDDPSSFRNQDVQFYNRKIFS